MMILASSGYLVLAAVLGFSGAVKLRHPRAFATAIEGYRILPRSLARPAALAIALAEAGCAVLLAAPWARLAGLAVAGGLVGAFLAAMSLALARGQRIGCGCFGGSADLDTVGLPSVLRAVLLEIIVVTSVLARPARRSRGRCPGARGGADAPPRVPAGRDRAVASGLAGHRRGPGGRTRMTALWTVIVLLSVIVAVDSLAVIALARQVGLLHLRAGQRPAPLPRSRPGPQPGSSLRLDVPPGLIGSQHELILYGFVRPECGACASALPAFTEVAAGLPGNERALLVSDRDEARTRAFLAANGVSLPVLTGPHLLQANGIPATPYAVVADRVGRVIAASTASSAEQLAAVLGEARHSGQITRASAPEAAH